MGLFLFSLMTHTMFRMGRATLSFPFMGKGTISNYTVLGSVRTVGQMSGRLGRGLGRTRQLKILIYYRVLWGVVGQQIHLMSRCWLCVGRPQYFHATWAFSEFVWIFSGCYICCIFLIEVVNWGFVVSLVFISTIILYYGLFVKYRIIFVLFLQETPNSLSGSARRRPNLAQLKIIQNTIKIKLSPASFVALN